MKKESRRIEIIPLLDEIAEELRLAREHVLVAQLHTSNYHPKNIH